jgi:hypothetical protein
MATLIGNALTILITVQKNLEMFKGTALGPEAPGTNHNGLCHSYSSILGSVRPSLNPHRLQKMSLTEVCR